MDEADAFLSAQDLDGLLETLIRRAFPEGFSIETGRLLYSALAGGEVVLRDGRRVHSSWRGTGGAIAAARGAGEYLDYYLGFRPHDDPEVASVRLRLLELPEVARLECSPRLDDGTHYPDERKDPEHPSGYDLSVVFDADLIRLTGSMIRPGRRSRPGPLAEQSR